MTRCVEFYEKCERDGYEWCEKGPSSISQIKSYLALVDKLEKAGVDRKFTFVKMPEAVARHTATLRDAKIDEMMPRLVALLNDETVEKVTTSTLDDIQTGYIKKKEQKTELVVSKLHESEITTKETFTNEEIIVHLQDKITQNKKEIKRLQDENKQCVIDIKKLKSASKTTQSKLPTEPVTLIARINATDDYAGQVKI
jgi:hypothetical protein